MGVCKVVCVCVYCVIVGLCSCAVTGGPAGLAWLGKLSWQGPWGAGTVKEVGRTPGLGV